MISEVPGRSDCRGPQGAAQGLGLLSAEAAETSDDAPLPASEIML